MVHHRSVPGAKNNHAVRDGAGPLANEAQSWFGNWIARGTCRRQRQRQRGPWWTWTHGHLLLEIGGHMQRPEARQGTGRDRGPGPPGQGPGTGHTHTHTGQGHQPGSCRIGTGAPRTATANSGDMVRRRRPGGFLIPGSPLQAISCSNQVGSGNYHAPPLGLSQVRRSAGILGRIPRQAVAEN